MSFPEPYYRWRPHPWHGLDIGPKAPKVVNAFIEITPFDRVKYEVDKTTGFLRVDRPQSTSSQPPVLYGFVPRTYCGKRVHALMPGSKSGDHDPLDICVISERPISRGEVIVDSRVIGGFPMNDGGEADDKIIAVLDSDPLWAHVDNLAQLPGILVERILHYFATYKLTSKDESNVQIAPAYGREHAETVIQASLDDYAEAFGEG